MPRFPQGRFATQKVPGTTGWTGPEFPANRTCFEQFVSPGFPWFKPMFNPSKPWVNPWVYHAFVCFNIFKLSWFFSRKWHLASGRGVGPGGFDLQNAGGTLFTCAIQRGWAEKHGACLGQFPGTRMKDVDCFEYVLMNISFCLRSTIKHVFDFLGHSDRWITKHWSLEASR